MLWQAIKNLPFGTLGHVEVRDLVLGEFRYRFPARSRRIVKRARKIGTKEPGPQALPIAVRFR